MPDTNKEKRESVAEQRQLRQTQAFDSLSGETDRGVPLIAGEWVSDCLEGLLRAAFDSNGIDGKLQHKLLNSFNAPLYTFAMRTMMCRAFAILDHKTCDELDALREIRNWCAHNPRIVQLDAHEIRPQVQRLLEIAKNLPMTEELTPRLTIIASAAFLSGLIWSVEQGIAESSVGGA